MITQELFAAWLRCETEAFLKVVRTDGGPREFLDWQQGMFDDYKHKSSLRLRANYRTDECGRPTSSLNDLSIGKYRIVIDCVVRTERIQARIHALERIPATKTRQYSPYIPIRFVPSQKITKHDKLLLAFDALALFMASGKEPLFGRIIHGVEQKVVAVRLKALMNIVSSLIERLEVQQASRTPPQLILNRHCVECEVPTRCRQVALEKDELSLLSGMTAKERKRQHDKGIFSVAQLSYTFRPRRKPRRSTTRQEKYHHALKALAIRERTIYVAGRPELSLTGTSVYLDVEGVPDRDLYYLIGLRVKTTVGYVQHSFWANEPSEEGEIWASFVRTLARFENPQLLITAATRPRS